MELSCINKWLIKLFPLRKRFIENMRFFSSLIMQIAILFMHKMHFKLKIWIKDQEKSSRYYEMIGLIMKMFVLVNRWLFKMHKTKQFRKESKKFWMKEAFSQQKGLN